MRVFNSNILIYHLNGQLPPAVQAQVDNRIKQGRIVSVVTRIEALGFPQSETEFVNTLPLPAPMGEEKRTSVPRKLSEPV